MSDNTKPNSKPVHEIKIWPCRAAIWRNGEFHHVTIDQSYKTDDKYHSTASLGRDALLAAAKCLDMAHTWILRAELQSRKEGAA